MQPIRRLTREQGREPAHDHCEEHDDAPQRQPDQVGDHQDQAERHRQAGAPQVVGHGEADGMVHGRTIDARPDGDDPAPPPDTP